jgi:hypothetical protein
MVTHLVVVASCSSSGAEHVIPQVLCGRSIYNVTAAPRCQKPL